MATDFITPQQASSETSVTTGRIYQIMRSGELPFYRCMGRLRIRKSDWEAFLEAKGKGHRGADQHAGKAQSQTT